MRIFVTIFLLCLNLSVFAQKELIADADEAYKELKYQEAVELYLKVLQKKSDHGKSIIKLANIYRLTNDFENAELYYAQVMTLPNRTSEHTLFYGQALMSNGKYEEAKKWFQYYAKVEPDDSRGKKLLKACDQVKTIQSLFPFYSTMNAEFNSGASDFGAFRTEGKTYFVSDRINNGKGKSYDWTGRGYLNIYEQSDLSEKSNKIPGKVNTKKFHDGPLTIATEKNKMYFSRNNFLVVQGQSKSGITKLKIYEAEFEGGKWTNIDVLSEKINNDNYSSTHPTISKNDSVMIYASNKKGGYGGYDLYKTIKKNGVWSRPKNLGSPINTEGNEVFPFLHESGDLYFSSDGHIGFGGLDVFKTTIRNVSKLEVTNVGTPINSAKDDFSVYFSSDYKNAFVASDRIEGKGSDDVYEFKEEKIMLMCKVVDKATNERIENAQLNIQFGNNLIEKTTSSRGIAKMEIGPNDLYQFTANAEGYKIATKTEKRNNQSFVDVTIKLNKKEPILVEKKKSIEIVALSELNKPIEDAIIKITTKEKEIIAKTDKFGVAKIEDLSEQEEYLVQISKDGFFNKTQKVESIEELKRTVKLKAFELNKAIKIENIYYDLDKAFIRPDAALELDKLVKILEDNPTIEIELSSHTDSRGSDDYNMDLSQRRAESAVKYIITKGIPKERLSAKGYGETKLVNNCSNGVKCSSKEHQLNRRTEFKVVKK